MLKKVVFVMLVAIFVQAVPRILNYQGKLLDSTGVGITDTVSMTFSIYTTETGGTPIWSETRNVEVIQGLFSVILGTVNPFPTTMDFSSQYFLEVSVNGETFPARERLTASPYAIRSMYAEKSIQAISSEANPGLLRTGRVVLSAGSGATLEETEGGVINITLGTCGGGSGVPQSLSQVLAVGNSAGGYSINMNNQSITNLAPPSNPLDATNMQYVTSLDGNGLSFSAGSYNVNVDNATLEISSDILRVRPSGIDSAQIAENAIRSWHIADGAIKGVDIDSAEIQGYNIKESAIGPRELASTTVTPGTYPNATITVDEDGRITFADTGAVSGLGGAGTANYLARFSDTHTIVSSAISEGSDYINMNNRKMLAMRLEIASTAPVTCDSAHNGYIYFNSTDNKVYVCRYYGVDDPSWPNYGSYEYKKFTTATTWNNARSTCQSYGGDLVSIPNSDVNNWLCSTLGCDGNPWIGFNDIAIEGTWVWSDGSPVTYTNWNTGEPNNSGGNEDCGQILYSPTGKWNDSSCSSSNPYICKRVFVGGWIPLN